MTAPGRRGLELPARQYFIAAGGWKTFCIEQGAGAPVLLLHGSSIAVDAWLTWFRSFEPLARSRRVIAYDQVGFGRSQVPADRIYLDRLRRTEHAQAVMDHLGLDDVTVVGHSEGGFIATRLAITNPGRVRKLVIVTSGGTAPRLGGERDRLWMAASERAYDYLARAVDVETFVRTEGHLRYRSDREFETLLRRNFAAAERSGNLETFLNKARAKSTFDDYTAVQEAWIHPFLRELATPSLLVWGGRDETVPANRGLALAELIPRSEFHLFLRSGHWVMHEEAASFNRLLDRWI